MRHIFGLLALGAVLASALPASAQRGISQPSTPESRAALHSAAACVVRSSEPRADALLRLDFRSTDYRTRMDALMEDNRDCVRARWMRSSRLLLAGTMAEHLMEAGAVPLNARLARLPATSTATPFTPTDAMAMCVARSDPDGLARLLATDGATEAENSAAAALAVAINRCAPTLRMSVSPAGLRAMLSTAAYRLLAAQEG